MKATPFGAFVANALSVVTRGLGYFLWYFLRVIYRGELRAMVPFAIGLLVIAAIVWLVR